MGLGEIARRREMYKDTNNANIYINSEERGSEKYRVYDINITPYPNSSDLLISFFIGDQDFPETFQIVEFSILPKYFYTLTNISRVETLIACRGARNGQE
jgi:hypothetical protein